MNEKKGMEQQKSTNPTNQTKPAALPLDGCFLVVGASEPTEVRINGPQGRRA